MWQHIFKPITNIPVLCNRYLDKSNGKGKNPQKNPEMPIDLHRNAQVQIFWSQKQIKYTEVSTKL